MAQIGPARGAKVNFPQDIDFAYPGDTMTPMEMLKSWLSAERGRVIGLARHLGVPPSFVSNMAEGRKSIPFEHGAAIDVFTGGAVSRRDMFPDDWQRLWPELATETTTQA